MSKHTRFQRGAPSQRALAQCPVQHLSISFVVSSNALLTATPAMSVPADALWAFETREIDEDRWSLLEDLFKARGYSFRPRLRKGWAPSWHTSGKSPLHSEDGEVLRVPQSLNHPILQLTIVS